MFYLIHTITLRSRWYSRFADKKAKAERSHSGWPGFTVGQWDMFTWVCASGSLSQRQWQTHGLKIWILTVFFSKTNLMMKPCGTEVMKKHEINTIQIHKYIFGIFPTDWGSVEKHDLGWLILSDRNTNMEEFIISGSVEKIVLDWDSSSVGFSARICKTELMLVRADGRQESWHFEYSKTSGWCYSEFPVFLDFLLKCHVDWKIMQKRGTNWNITLTSHGIPEGMLKTVNPFSSTPKAEHKYLRRKRLYHEVHLGAFEDRFPQRTPWYGSKR